ncbi:LPD7 domain-containing protein [Sulfurirhabdus autotrophica]|uniref:Large polyvalent protein-associated domain-containing protein n=1 Tax=Sulfurirhabdus autotrophica TaxID=1706046 RepID=A0A4R3XUZ2_9PROT|nr:LPD7 domain-containing protein [Sulfurirhabdus autotrophica]TCV82727.1 hypothetical protein EDC63_11944 [Sulfurirhabdus autotrophica]
MANTENVSSIDLIKSTNVTQDSPDKAEPIRNAQGVPLESLGKGKSVADIDSKTRDVVIRRTGRVIERFDSPESVEDFAQKKNLSERDRDTLNKLVTVRHLDANERDVVKQSLGTQVVQKSPDDALNIIERENEKGRIRDEVKKTNTEIHAWVERQKRLRAEKAAKISKQIETDNEPVAAVNNHKTPEVKPGDSIEREDVFAAPNTRYKFVPPEINKKYLHVGDKYHNLDSAKTVAFIDRGDKLQTSSSSPQVAEDLVKIADARGWDELRVRGTDAFKREVWLEASVRGIHVDGFKPSELDKAELERRSTFIREENSIEVRSNAFERLSPSEGVRQDPTLVNAYATIAAAKAFAKEKIHDDASKSSFVNSVKQAVTQKIETNQTVGKVQLRVPEGTLIEHGQANYNFDKDEKNSYFVKLKDNSGKERILWGVGLKNAMIKADAKPGDKLRLKVAESKGVVVEANIRDANNQIIGTKTVDSHRNEWQAEIVGREQIQAPMQSKGRGRSV